MSGVFAWHLNKGSGTELCAVTVDIKTFLCGFCTDASDNLANWQGDGNSSQLANVDGQQVGCVCEFHM